jgi:hypothetical protein
MAYRMTRREFAATAAGLAAIGFTTTAKGANTKTLRFIAGSDLRVLDPIWTTACLSLNSPDLPIRCGCAMAQRNRRRIKPSPLHPHLGRNGST